MNIECKCGKGSENIIDCPLCDNEFIQTHEELHKHLELTHKVQRGRILSWDYNTKQSLAVVKNETSKIIIFEKRYPK